MHVQFFTAGKERQHCFPLHTGAAGIWSKTRIRSDTRISLM